MRKPQAQLAAALASITLLVACASPSSNARGPETGLTPLGTAPGNSDGGEGKASGKNKPEKDESVELASDPAPEFEVETFEGGTFAIREELGTPVVLNFWESW
jgi:hypothetical protein